MKTEIWFELGSDTKNYSNVAKSEFCATKRQQIDSRDEINVNGFFLKSWLKLGMYVSFV